VHLITAVALDKFAIARLLRETSALLALEGGNPFRARAYEKGADAIEAVRDDVGELVATGRLTESAGIGKALAGVIAELHRTGTTRQLDELRAKNPPGILELSQVPGMTETRIRALHASLGISTIEELRAACEAGRVRTIKGFGAKTEAKLLDGVARWEKHDERMLLIDAVVAAEPMLLALRACRAATCVDVVGSIRRFEETVPSIELLAASGRPEAVIAHFERDPRVTRVDLRTHDAARVRLAGGDVANLHVVSEREYALALLRHTGSDAHVAKLAARARAEGLELDALALHSEEAIYDRLGLPFIPPELREDEGEFEGALAGETFDDLVTFDDVQGMVHCHTIYSDGRDTIEAMARGAEALGMKYLTITDHSQAAHYAGGVDVDRLKEQWDEIARVQEHVSVKLLRGTEADILDDGAIDWPDSILERFDVVIASVHSKMKMDEDTMTKRLVRAMKAPHFKIWGHALGRLIQRRAPYACRVEEVLDAVAESRAAIEVNGDPYRLDMEPRWIRAARQRKIPFVISTDAHSVSGMKALRFGVGIARRGGLRRTEVLNTRSAERFLRAVRPAA
jgi:DNA polymerase (family X)